MTLSESNRILTESKPEVQKSIDLLKVKTRYTESSILVYSICNVEIQK